MLVSMTYIYAEALLTPLPYLIEKFTRFLMQAQ